MVNVDPEKFRQAADNFDAISTQADSYGSAARSALMAFDGMAGTDPGGEQFAEAYDQMATVALQGFADTEVSARDLDRGLMASAITHAQANANAGRIVYDAQGVYQQRPKVPASTVAPPPSAFGGRPDTVIDGLDSAAVWIWDQIMNVVGTLFPDGDPDKLRQAGSTWVGILGDFRALRTSITTADSPLAGMESGEIASIGSKVDDFADGLTTFIGDAEGIGQIDDICRDYADRIEETHRESRQLMVQLVIEVVASMAVGGLLSVVTFGASAVVAGSTIAIRIANIGARIATLVQRCVNAAIQLSSKLRAIVTALRTAGTKFPRLTRVGIEVVAGTSGATAAEFADPNPNFIAAVAGGFGGSGITAAMTAPFGNAGKRFLVQALANGAGGVGGTAVDMSIRGEEITAGDLALSAGLGVVMSARLPGRKAPTSTNVDGGRVQAPDANIPVGVGGDASGSNVEGGGVKTNYEGPGGAGNEVSGNGGDGGTAPSDHGTAPGEVEIVVTPPAGEGATGGDGGSTGNQAPDTAPPADLTPEPKPDPQPEVKPDPQPEAKPDPQPEAKPDPQPEVKPDPQSEVKPDPQPEVKPDPQPEAKPDPTPESSVDPTPEGGAENTGPGSRGVPHGGGEFEGGRPPRDEDFEGPSPKDDAETDATGEGDEAASDADDKDATSSPDEDAAPTPPPAGPERVSTANWDPSTSSNPHVRDLFDADGNVRSFEEWNALHGDPDAPLNHNKGEYGELQAQAYMESNGWTRIDDGADGSHNPNRNGVDGIYTRTDGDGQPEFAVIEAKYNTGRLGNTLDGKQMSGDWLVGEKSGTNRLENAMQNDPEALADITDAFNSGELKTGLVHVTPDGELRVRALDDDAKVIAGSESAFTGSGGGPIDPPVSGASTGVESNPPNVPPHTSLDAPPPHAGADAPQLPATEMDAINQQFRLPSGEVDPTRLDEWAEAVSDAYPALTPDQVRGIYDYTTNPGYDAMNPYLRDMGTPPADVADLETRITNATEGLSNLPAEPSLGEPYSRGVRMFPEFLDQFQVGQTWSDPSFMSSSNNPVVAENFAQQALGTGDTPGIITIDGQTPASITPLSRYQNEAEFLFQRGTQFEVVSKFQDADGVWRIHLREIEE